MYIEEETMSLLVFHYCICVFLSLSQFQPISVLFVTVSAVLCCCLKAMLLV